MTYKECLDFIKDNNLNVLQMVVAKEVYDQLVTPKLINNYEEVCSYIYSCSLETDLISVATLTQCFGDLIENKEYTEKEILGLRFYKFIDKASYY